MCIINSVHPKNHELFALPLLLRRFCARSWEQLRTHNGEICESFYEAARQFGLVSDQDNEAAICLQDAIDFHASSYDIRFRLAQMVYYGASRDLLESRFGEHLADDGDTVDSIHQKIDRLLHPGS
jgi:hypothetical protein